MSRPLMPDTGIEDAQRREERAVVAMEKLATALTDIAILGAKWFEKEHPARPEPKDATISRIPSPEDTLRTEQGVTGEETTDEWSELGPREKELINKKPQ